MGKGEETVKAHVDGVPTELVFVADGYMAPSSFQVRRELGRPGSGRKDLTVTIDVEIEDKRVISQRVVVEDPKGVSSITLRQIQVREWAAEELLQLLRRARVQPDGTMRIGLLAESEIDEALEIVRRLVGYAPQVIGGGPLQLASREEEGPS